MQIWFLFLFLEGERRMFLQFLLFCFFAFSILIYFFLIFYAYEMCHFLRSSIIFLLIVLLFYVNLSHIVLYCIIVFYYILLHYQFINPFIFTINLIEKKFWSSQSFCILWSYLLYQFWFNSIPFIFLFHCFHLPLCDSYFPLTYIFLNLASQSLI